MLKKFISSVILISFLAPTYQAFAFEDNLTIINEKIIEGNTIPRLEDNGESLQYSKKDLSNKLIDSELEIESFNINSNNQVSIEGALHYNNNESKDFMLTGELQNSLEENKERIILKLTDSLNNFDVIDFSLHKSSNNLTLFNSELNEISNENIFNIYLLDKENRNFSIFENKFDNDPQINNLFENKEKFNAADMEDVLWIGKVLNISETSLIESPEQNISTFVIPSTHTEMTYTYNNSYTFFGHNYKDSMLVFLQLLYPNYLPNEATAMGYSKILVYSNTSKNLTTGANGTSSILLGKTAAPTITVATNQDVAFTSASFASQANSAPVLDAGFKWSYSIGLKAGLSFAFSYKPGSTSVKSGNFESINNFPTYNEYARNYSHSLGGARYLTNSGDVIDSQFYIKDFGKDKNSFNIESQYSLPFHNYITGSTETLTFGRVSALIPQQ